MTGPAEPLRPLVEALRVSPSGAILLGERRVGQVAGAEPGRLAEALMICVYEHGYTLPFPPPERESGDETRNLGPVIAAANSTKPRSETGWVVTESWADGSVVATRNGRLRRLGPGQFMSVDGSYPLATGSSLMVQLPAGSATRQPGFYYCFAEGFRDAHDQAPIVRLYFNLMEAGAAKFVAMATGALNRFEIPFELKVTTDSAQFARRDNAVLYLSQDLFNAAVLALAAVLPVLRDTLSPGTPLFTKELAPGVGLAEDPGHNDSFGSARSRLAAVAIADARDGERFCWSRFELRFAEAVRDAKLDMKALWLNPGSKDIYSFPQHSPRLAAA